MYNKNISVTDELIREKTKRILKEFNQNKSENEKIEMNFCNGWL